MILALLGAFTQVFAKNEIAVGAIALYAPGGGSANYNSIQAAYNAIDFNTLAGAYTIEVASTYNVANETLPVNLTAKTGASESNTITIRPATSLTITAATKIISFNGAKFVTVDGRAGGSGTTKGFTFENTSIAATASTIDFVNDAYKNTLKYCTVLGAQVAPGGGAPAPINSGNIVIGTTTGTTVRDGDATAGFTGSGNLYNTIDNCNIADASTGLPTAGVCMIGTPTYTNEGNVVSNCNIYNCFNPNYNYSAAVFIGANSLSSVITNNKIYQTAARTFFTYGIHTPIHVNSATKEISFNTIGYATSNGTGIYTIGGAQSHKFQGMKLTGTVTTLKGNVISDIDISSTSVGAPNVGIVCGVFNEGNNFPAGDANNPNIIRNITLNGSGALAANATFSIAGISSTSWGGGSILYNTIDNLKVNFTGTNALTIKGIIYGIYAIQSWGITAKQNRISNLQVGVAGNSGANTITAIYAAPQANQAVIVEQNEIYNLNSISSSAAIINGIVPNNFTKTTLSADEINKGLTTVDPGISTISNNVIVLGNNMASPAEIRVISKITVGTLKAYHNSIYIGGNATGTTANTYCVYSNPVAQTIASPRTLGEEYINNIFVNKRTGGSTGNHYAFSMSNAADYSGGFIAFNNNLLLTDATAKLAYIGADVANFAALGTSYPNFATDCVNAEPMFIDATAATPDLHISSASSPANQSGIAIASVTKDFAGAVRADYTPIDLGAYVIAGSTAVERNVATSKLNIYTAANEIIITNLSGRMASIYSFNGQLLKSVALTSDKVSISSAKGCYIVKVGTEVAKVFVK